jgi:hypothetical protein
MADSRWLYTPIGGGKSLYSVMEFYKELERTERFCVNNLPIIFDNPPEKYQTAAEYCHLWITKPVNLHNRCFTLTADQSREFWRYLPLGTLTEADIAKYRLEVVRNETPLGTTVGVKMPNKPHPLYKEVCDFSLRNDPDSPYYQRGCFYQLDECHKNFPARYWQNLGPQVEDYVSELRKFNDDVDWITQHPEKVDKNLRRNATEWVQITNLMKTRLFMGVTLNKRFRFYAYQQVDMPSRSDKPDYSGGFQIGKKKRVEFTYLTLQGQSARGGTGTEEIRHKGNHPIVWVLAILVIFAVAHYLPPMVEKSVQMAVGGFTGGIQKGVAKGVAQSMPAPPMEAQPAPATPAVVVPPKINFPPVVRRQTASRSDVTGLRTAGGDSALHCTGWMQEGTNILVLLSDGELADSSQGEVQGVGRRAVRVFGLPPIPIR